MTDSKQYYEMFDKVQRGEITQKKLEKFKKDFSALLNKHPEITVSGDINGDPVAYIFDGIKTKTIKLINEG